MKKRIAGAALFGAGLFFLVVALSLGFVVVPLLSRIPFDLKPPVTAVIAHDATFVQATVVNDVPTAVIGHADLVSTTGINPDAAAAADIGGSMKNKAVVWNVFTQTRRSDTGDVISSSNGRIAMDRVTGAAVAWNGECYADQLGQACQASNIAYSGQLYAFPFNTRKTTYQYYDITLRKALPIEYQGTETVKGLTTYRFTQVVPERQLTVDSATLDFLAGSLAPGATGGSMWYSATRTVWVEPVTGSVVNYAEEQHRTLRTDSGASVVLLDAKFQYTPQTLTEVARQTSDGRLLLVGLGRWVPVALIVLALAALVSGFLLTRRAARPVPPAAHRADEDRTEPAPV
ncbi:MAG: hypothetical protein V7603_3808 [Micromonosporaceae bacterium]